MGGGVASVTCRPRALINVALFAMPMMAGAAHFWLVRRGFYFTRAGAELPLVWLALLGLQVIAGDGRYALVASPNPNQILARLRLTRSA